MTDLMALVTISKYAGERYDLVQAGGGNSSVKLDNGVMLIKASGFLLSDVTENGGYSQVMTHAIAQIVTRREIFTCKNKRDREALTSSFVKEATIDKHNRPSIETLLHSLLHKYTLHTHPISVNILLNRKDWKECLKFLFGEDIGLVAYQTPGIELALELAKEISRFEKIPKIIFLQNHGLIVTSDKAEDIQALTEYTLVKIEQYLALNLSKYKLTNKISSLIKRVDANSSIIAYLSNDGELNALLHTHKLLFFKAPFCPDALVYCGMGIVEIAELDDIQSICQYQQKYHELPKIILYQEKLFIVAHTIKKAKEIEEVLKFHVVVLSYNSENINFLEQDELDYLSNWEAEKYRQKV